MATQKRFQAKNGLDNNSKTITGVANPVNAQDAATKDFSSNASNLTAGTLSAARLPAFTGTKTAARFNREKRPSGSGLPAVFRKRAMVGKSVSEKQTSDSETKAERKSPSVNRHGRIHGCCTC